MVHKSSKRKVVQLTEVQKEVQEVASIIVLILTKTISEANGKTPSKETTYELHVEKKKLRKMVLLAINDEEEEKRMNNLLLG